jgi:hypothetical protein
MAQGDAILRGIANIRGRKERIEREREEREANKATWFRLKKDGDSAMIRFLQELDEDAPGYNADRGTGFVALEHQNPKEYMRKGLCSVDTEGMCKGCETHQLDYKGGWHIRERLYINVLVKIGREEPFVAVLSQGTSGKSITPTLLEYAEDGGITNRWFKISRVGSTFNDTSYTLVGKDADNETFDEYEVFDLNNVVRNVPYADQAAHYGLLASRPDDEERPPADTPDDAW